MEQEAYTGPRQGFKKAAKVEVTKKREPLLVDSGPVSARVQVLVAVTGRKGEAEGTGGDDSDGRRGGVLHLRPAAVCRVSTGLPTH